MEKGTQGGSAARQGGQCEFGREEAVGDGEEQHIWDQEWSRALQWNYYQKQMNTCIFQNW